MLQVFIMKRPSTFPPGNYVAMLDHLTAPIFA